MGSEYPKVGYHDTILIPLTSGQLKYQYALRIPIRYPLQILPAKYVTSKFCHP